MQARPGVGQIQSVSVLQSGEHPSPPVRFPSSQVSAGGLSMPFPHGLQLAGGPSQDVSLPPLMSGTEASTRMSIAASTTGGPPPCPPCPPVPLVLLLETPAHPAAASTSACAISQAFTL